MSCVVIDLQKKNNMCSTTCFSKSQILNVLLGNLMTKLWSFRFFFLRQNVLQHLTWKGTQFKSLKNQVSKIIEVRGKLNKMFFVCSFAHYAMWKELFMYCVGLPQQKEYLVKYRVKSHAKLWTTFLITGRTKAGRHADVFCLACLSR